MRKIIIAFLLMLLVFTACSKYSDVKPITEETEPKEHIEKETTEEQEELAVVQPTEEEPIGDITEQPEKPIENEIIEEPEEQTGIEITEEVKIETGKFSGMIDANFFEVQISGVPESIAARVFMLTEDSREIFNELKLQPNDEIKIHYYLNEYEQMVVVNIEKL